MLETLSLIQMITAYEQFINYCSSIEDKEINSGIYIEKHHIIPRHSGGSNDKSNIIRLSRKNHILAHYYRWLSYNSNPDKIAYYFMTGDPTGEAKRESGKLAQKTWTPEKRSKCAKKAYQTMIKRNSGVVNRGDSWRKNVSKAAKANIISNRSKRHSQETQKLLNSRFKFTFSSRSIFIDQRDFTDFVQTSKYLCSLLGIVIKDSEHKRFIRLVKKERSIFHGIRLDMAISSQAGDGLSSPGRFRD